MNTQVVAIVIQECSKLFGHWFRNRPILIKTASPAPPAPPAEQPQQVPEPQPSEQPQEIPEGEATEVATGCIPCAIGHFGTCSGLLNEATRFAHSDGMESNQVIDRVGKCLDELNAMERVDLRPEMIVSLPDWERELADQVLVVSRTTRHALEGFDSVTALEEAAAQTQTLRTQIWRKWIKSKMKHLTTAEQAKIREKVIEKLEELEEGEEVAVR